MRQLEEELRLAHMRNPDQEIQQHIDALYSEKEHMSKEIYLLRETIKVSCVRDPSFPKTCRVNHAFHTTIFLICPRFFPSLRLPLTIIVSIA